MGIDFLAWGKRVLKRRGVHAPAVIMRREQGIMIAEEGSVEEVMVMEERVPEGEKLTDVGREGRWR